MPYGKPVSTDSSYNSIAVDHKVAHIVEMHQNSTKPFVGYQVTLTPSTNLNPGGYAQWRDHTRFADGDTSILLVATIGRTQDPDGVLVVRPVVVPCPVAAPPGGKHDCCL